MSNWSALLVNESTVGMGTQPQPRAGQGQNVTHSDDVMRTYDKMLSPFPGQGQAERVAALVSGFVRSSNS